MQEIFHEILFVDDADEILIQRGDFRVRLATTRGHRNKCSLLVHSMYSWRGYQTHHIEEPACANQMTLEACRNDDVFGTLSVCFDSPSGLSADAAYKEEIDEFRRSGAKVCEMTRLAVDPAKGSKEVLGALFHLAYIFCVFVHGATDIFIEVNPRHALFYKRMLGFDQVGEQKVCVRVDAPSVLLRISVAYVGQQVARYGGHNGRGKRSLYPYFFSLEEEKGLARRLRPHASPQSVTM